MFIYANKRNWKQYLKPKWMNPVTYKEANRKIYRWLIFRWSIPRVSWQGNKLFKSKHLDILLFDFWRFGTNFIFPEKGLAIHLGLISIYIVL